MNALDCALLPDRIWGRLKTSTGVAPNRNDGRYSQYAVEVGRRKMTAAWSRRCSSCRGREYHGATCGSAMARVVPSTADIGVSAHQDSSGISARRLWAGRLERCSTSTARTSSCTKTAQTPWRAVRSGNWAHKGRYQYQARCFGGRPGPRGRAQRGPWTAPRPHGGRAIAAVPAPPARGRRQGFRPKLPPIPSTSAGHSPVHSSQAQS